MLSFTHHAFICEFHMVCYYHPLKFWWQNSVYAGDIIQFATILKSLKTCFCMIKIILAPNQLQIMQSLHSWKKLFGFFV